MGESIIIVYWTLEGIIIDTLLLISNNLTYKKACDAVYIQIYVYIYVYINIYTIYIYMYIYKYI